MELFLTVCFYSSKTGAKTLLEVVHSSLCSRNETPKAGAGVNNGF